MPKTKQKKTIAKKNKGALKDHITHPKLIIFLLALLLVPATMALYSKYKDWDNAQFIKGLTQDFPQLVEEVEQAIDRDLDIEVNCSTTQEKFGSGVSTCEAVTSLVGEESSFDSGHSVLRNASNFPVHSNYQNGEGVNAKYRNKKSCQFRTEGAIYISCITGVREANIELAREEFGKLLEE